MKHLVGITVLSAALALAPPMSASTSDARDDLQDFLKSAREDLYAFRDSALAERDAFRDRVINELAAWMSQKWEPKPMEDPIAPPHNDKPVPPLVLPQGEEVPQPKDEPMRDNPEVAPSPLPAPPSPTPVLPPAPPAPDPVDFVFRSYGTIYHVDASPELKFGLPHASSREPGAEMARALDKMDAELFDRLSSSFAAEAKRHNLSDWAYLKLTRHFAESFVPGNANAQRFLEGLLLISAGYDVRFGESVKEGRLYTLTGCREMIPGEAYFELGDDNYYYPFEDMQDTELRVTSSRFGTTRVMSAQPTGKEIFDNKPGASRTVIVCAHHPHCYKNKCSSPSESFTLTGNANRMAYFADCPAFLINDNTFTKWNSYAHAHMSDEYKAQLYPAMKRATAEMSGLEKVNFLMRFVEAFEYGYDSEIWGEDRPFFPDETLFYPYRDCEDGAILLTRLVRDLTQLPVALVYYPSSPNYSGHMAAAVAFDTAVSGPYLTYNGRRYTICDPTIYYADAGVQMPSDKVDIANAVLIPLD